MAHGDYNCCAVCDAKLDYNADEARTKEETCTDCLKALRDAGVTPLPLDPEELMAWMRRDPGATAVLRRVGYRRCFYRNEVDQLFAELTPLATPAPQGATQEGEG